MTIPHFRFATLDNVPALHALVERAYRGKAARGGWTHEADLLDGQRTDAAALSAMIGDASQRIVIAEIGGEVAGCIAVQAKPPAAAYLGMVTVAPDRQAAGLGRSLLAEGERVAAVMFGATLAEMTVICQRAELIAWYERRGYRATGERRPFPYGDTRFGEPRTDALEFMVLAKPL
ncbi:GNAT family N-acetyltransferase [Sphingomonas sp. Y38-1Y]|uniref:GNAT family N-acetyltransferase n=1 Tax=Sphingomonas sp. Y38-1Y TaxID=3078265 RepID=UPI0028F0F578|nr:GNAT family N-acetyltransferase [Sphingomonas sp. Y38-1Y]